MIAYVSIMHLLLIIKVITSFGEFHMRATKTNIMTLWVLMLLVLPFVAMPVSSAWTAGDEAAIFGHTFTEEHWTNNSLFVQGEKGNGSLTTSFVHVGDFDAFLIAFNEFNLTDGTQMIVPYQLFGMHFITPGNQEVFIGAIFAFLLVTNDTIQPDKNLPDVGNEPSWYVVPVANSTMFPGYKPSVQPIPATKLADDHYRMGMHYYNLTCRIVEANTLAGFLATLAIPVLQVVISELTIQYDIFIDATGEVHAETLYTIGQVKAAKILGIDVEPSDLVVPTMEISAVHFLSVFASHYTVVGTTSGNTIASPTDTTPMDENVTIEVGSHERAFDIGFGRSYDLRNETTGTVVNSSLTAINTLLGVRLGDLLLIAWQAPLSAWLFAHMAYGLSTQLRNTYSTVGAMVNNVNTAFTSSNWWYGVTFPEWNGLRIQQDPVYTAYTNLAVQPSGGGVVVLLLLVVGVLAVVFIIRRRR
jgi:hypothetical protein